MSENDRSGSAAGDPRDAALSRRYREAAEEVPPAYLDAAILAAARRDAGARPRPLGAFSASRWRLPVALAAVVVLSVSLVTVVIDERGNELSAPPRAAAPAPGASSEPARTLGKLAEESARAGNDPAAVPERKLERIQPGRAVADAEQRADRSRPEPDAAAAEKSSPAEPFAIAPTDAPQVKRRAAAERDAASAPRAQVVPAAPAPAGAGGVAAMQREGFADEMKSDAAAPRLSPEIARQVRALAAEPPAKWLERIAELRRAGRDSEADELLAEFRRRFPQHAVPRDLEK